MGIKPRIEDSDRYGWIQLSLGNWIPISDIKFVLTARSNQAAAFRNKWRKHGRPIYRFAGKMKMRSMIITRSNELLLSKFNPTTIINRMEYWFVDRK